MQHRRRQTSPRQSSRDFYGELVIEALAAGWPHLALSDRDARSSQQGCYPRTCEPNMALRGGRSPY